VLVVVVVVVDVNTEQSNVLLMVLTALIKDIVIKT
jgi:hypothetical protein